ncbi:membrane protein [Knoellia subterranea KCTC 19937]|uniref:Membrane protein n=1 Tax=Knoellia subterranea KCTC 19937 TaxID=1385521 RepID=A0A0A0JL95_9MICO|nr:membrane protein [Knoellia subterranea KCTC 19937]
MLAVAVFVATYFLIATERIHRVAAAVGGVALMAILGIVDTETAFYSERSGIDWNVIFLLFGMMIVVSILKQTGLFDYLAVWAAQRSRGRPFRLMALLMTVTATASALLDNVTTVLLMAPVALMVCRRLGLDPVPYLITLAFSSNVGGAATLIGDPPNIIIASRAGLSFNDFLVHMTPIVIVMQVLLLGLAWLLFRRRLDARAGRAGDLADTICDLSPGDEIRDRRMLRRCLVVLALVMVGFSLHSVLHVQPSLIALLGAWLMVLVSGAHPAQFLEEVEWPTLAFFMALFVLVGGLVETGVIGNLGEAAVAATGDQSFAAASFLLFGSAVLGAFVDNIPYTTAMAPVVQDLVASLPAAEGQSLWWAFALGADLGGNTTAVAAGANVVIIGIAARNGTPVSFWEFTRYGLIVTAMTLVVAWAYVWARYFAFA